MKQNYQNLSFQLDEVLTQLQRVDIDVDEAVALYEQGMRLIAQSKKYLKSAENKIEKIKLEQDSPA